MKERRVCVCEHVGVKNSRNPIRNAPLGPQTTEDVTILASHGLWCLTSLYPTDDLVEAPSLEMLRIDRESWISFLHQDFYKHRNPDLLSGTFLLVPTDVSEDLNVCSAGALTAVATRALSRNLLSLGQFVCLQH